MDGLKFFLQLKKKSTWFFTLNRRERRKQQSDMRGRVEGKNRKNGIWYHISCSIKFFISCQGRQFLSLRPHHPNATTQYPSGSCDPLSCSGSHVVFQKPGSTAPCVYGEKQKLGHSFHGPHSTPSRLQSVPFPLLKKVWLPTSCTWRTNIAVGKPTIPIKKN